MAGQQNQLQQNRTIHIIHHAFRRGGGMERCAVLLASSLKSLGWPVTVHTMTPDAALTKSLGLELDVVPVRSFPRKLQSYRFFRQIERNRPKLDGLQITFSRVPVGDVLICGGTHRGYLARSRKWAGPFDWLEMWMEEKSYRQARVLVAHSDLVASDLMKRHGIQQQKIHVLYPPLDERFSKPSVAIPRTELRKRFGWPEDKIVFLFPSKGHRNKGLHRICEAMKPFSDQVLLVVAGKSPGRIQPPFVTNLGYVEDMAAIYRAADFTTLGSYYESFGLVGPESVLCGTRLVFEENIGCLPVVQPELVLKFSVWDLGSIRNAIAQAIALAKQGRHRVEDPGNALRYDPSPMAHAQAVLKAAGF